MSKHVIQDRTHSCPSRRNWPVAHGVDGRILVILVIFMIIVPCNAKVMFPSTSRDVRDSFHVRANSFKVQITM